MDSPSSSSSWSTASSSNLSVRSVPASSRSNSSSVFFVSSVSSVFSEDMDDEPLDISSSSMDSWDDEVDVIGQTEEATEMPSIQTPPGDNSEGEPLFNMLNEYVVTHLLSFLPLADIKNCRLVSRLLNQHCLRAIPMMTMTRHLVTIPRDSEKLSELINLINKSPQFPWTNFKVNAIKIGHASKEKKLLANLFQIVAPFITGLRIDNLSAHLFTNVFQYPALRNLRISYYRGDHRPKFSIDIVENAPNLQKLDLRAGTCQMTDRLVNLVDTDNWRKITRLALHSVIEDYNLIRLSQMNLQLSYLNLTFCTAAYGRDYAVISKESIMAFLESQSSHLKELKLKRKTSANNLCREIQFPRMEKLTILKIAFPTEYLGICYPTLFPALKKLKLDLEDTEMVLEYWLKADMKPVETVEELMLCEGIADCQVILNAARLFPNLRKLQMYNDRILLDCATLSISGLEELWLLCDEDYQLDINLTGMSEEAYDKVRSLPTSQLKTWEKNWEPNRWFKNLKKLGLVAANTSRSDGNGGELKITKFGCRFGLLKLDRLETLTLVGDCSQISSKVMQALKKKFIVNVQNKV